MALLLIFVITAIVLLIIKALIAEDSSSTTQPTKAEVKEEAWTPPQTFDEVVLTFAKAAYALSYFGRTEVFAGMDVQGEYVKSFVSLDLRGNDWNIQHDIDSAFRIDKLPKAMGSWLLQYVENKKDFRYSITMPISAAQCSGYYDDLICDVSDTCQSYTYQLHTRRDEIGGAIVAFPKREFQL